MPASVQSAFNSLISGTLAAATIGSHTYKRTAFAQSREDIAQAKRAVGAIREIKAQGALSETQQKVASDLAARAQSNLEAAVVKNPSTRNIEYLDQVRESRKAQEQQFAQSNTQPLTPEQEAAMAQQEQEMIPEGAIIYNEDPGIAALASLERAMITKQNQKQGRIEREEALKRG